MIYTLNPPLIIPAGEKVAQLIPFYSKVPRPGDIPRLMGGFGSTGQPNVMLAIDITKGKPTEIVTISHPNGQSIKISAILDTGAGVTIVPLHVWPKTWPLQPAPTGVVGVGGGQQAFISLDVVSSLFSDGARVNVKPYVLNLPIALVGRDVLSQFHTKLIPMPF